MSRVFDGTVLSLKMQKTAVVEVIRKKPHPLYRKLLKRSKKYKADTLDLSLTVGDHVRIVETRPISKDKYFKVEKVLSGQKKESVHSTSSGDNLGEEKKEVKRVRRTRKSTKDTSEGGKNDTE